MERKRATALSVIMTAIFVLGIFTIFITKPETTNAKSMVQKKNLITKEQAQATAIQRAGQGKIVKCKLDRDDGRVEYEVVIINGDTKHEVDIDAYSNTIIKYEQERITKTRSTMTNDMIAPGRAKEIALDRVGGGTIVECTLEYEDDYRAVIYDVEVVIDTTKYELDIDAKTGRILKQKADTNYGVDDII